MLTGAQSRQTVNGNWRLLGTNVADLGSLSLSLSLSACLHILYTRTAGFMFGGVGE